MLYLRDGTWDGARLLPRGWVDYGRTIASVDPEDGPYGAHWWGVEGDTLGTFRASGYEGQSITICPTHDLVVVRLGKTAAAHYPDLTRWRAERGAGVRHRLSDSAWTRTWPAPHVAIPMRNFY